MERGAGLLLHITSLSNKYGIGTLGVEAYKFIDFLAKAGQKYWQVLPITPTNYGDSPYQSSSVFAFNPYLIDLDFLNDMNLLKQDDYKNLDFGSNELDIDYQKLFYQKNKVLKETYKKRGLFTKQYQKFCKENEEWLEGFALYSVIKEQFGFTAWNTWPEVYRLRDAETIKQFVKEHKPEIETIKFIQFLFYYQWSKLKAYANASGIALIGDMPIYAAYDSADVWMNPGMFWLDHNLQMVKVAGCPPDAFSEDGQLWGNPLYRWDLIKEQEYSWWVTRIKKALELFDVIRIDHFRGFAGYYAIPFGDTTARNGEWISGPGYELFKKINEAVPNAKIIAENLGFLDDDVKQLLEDCQYPGMNIAQFDFGDGETYCPLKDGLTENNIIYTGTHDNQTILSWYQSLSVAVKERADAFFGIQSEVEAPVKIIEKVFEASPFVVMIPLQDYLGLTDQEGRMNIPATLGCNWRYRARRTDYSMALAERIRVLTEKTNRL